MYYYSMCKLKDITFMKVYRYSGTFLTAMLFSLKACVLKEVHILYLYNNRIHNSKPIDHKDLNPDKGAHIEHTIV